MPLSREVKKLCWYCLKDKTKNEFEAVPGFFRFQLRKKGCSFDQADRICFDCALKILEGKT